MLSAFARGLVYDGIDKISGHFRPRRGRDSGSDCDTRAARRIGPGFAILSPLFAGEADLATGGIPRLGPVPDPLYEPPSAENLREGKHWHLLGNMIAPVAERAAAWEAMKPDFLAAGWEVSKILTSGTYTVVLHYARNNTEAWSNVDVTGTPGIEITVIEAAPIPHSLTLPEPAAR